MQMQDYVGSTLVLIGLGLTVAQAIALVVALLPGRDAAARLAAAAANQAVTPTPPWFVQIIGLLLDKLPAAAVGLTYIWIGALILRWFGASSE